MIVQWENECISLSVLSMARDMIAQWENVKILTFVGVLATQCRGAWCNNTIIELSLHYVVIESTV